MAFSEAFGAPLTTRSAGWAFSADGLAWTRCDVRTAACNGGTSAESIVDAVLGIGPGILLDKPSLASAAGTFGPGQNSQVIMVLLRDTDNNFDTAEQVVALRSVNSGQTFTSAALVSDGSCNGGAPVDLPHVTMDYTARLLPSAFIVWTTGTVTTTVCMRQAVLDSGLLLATSTWPVTSSPATIGGAMIQATHGAATVVYQIAAFHNDCPDVTPLTVGWMSTTTLDGGAHWTDPRTIFSTSNYVSCLVTGAAPSRQVRNTRRAFGFTRTLRDNRMSPSGTAPPSGTRRTRSASFIRPTTDCFGESYAEEPRRFGRRRGAAMRSPRSRRRSIKAFSCRHLHRTRTIASLSRTTRRIPIPQPPQQQTDAGDSHVGQSAHARLQHGAHAPARAHAKPAEKKKKKGGGNGSGGRAKAPVHVPREECSYALERTTEWIDVFHDERIPWREELPFARALRICEPRSQSSSRFLSPSETRCLSNHAAHGNSRKPPNAIAKSAVKLAGGGPKIEPAYAPARKRTNSQKNT